MQSEASKVWDAAGAWICGALIDRLMSDLKAAVGFKVPLEDWLIVTSERQLNNFAALFERPEPSGMAEVKEAEYPVPVEIKYAGIRWVADETIPPDVLRMEAGKKGYGLIINLGGGDR